MDGMQQQVTHDRARPHHRTEAESSLNAHQQLQADYARVLARAEQQEHQVRTLFALTQSIAVTMEPDDLRQSIVESLYEALRADTTSLFEREPDGQLRMVAQCNIDLTRARLIFGPDEGLVALAAREHRLVHVPDTTSSAHYLTTGYDHPRSLLAVPVEPQPGAEYVLCVVRRRVYAFTDDELQFASLMANVAAHSLSNATLYREMRGMAREQATFYALTRASSLSDGVSSFIGRAVEPLQQALDATGCAIVLLDPTTPLAQRSANHGLSADGLARCEAFATHLGADTKATNVVIRCDVNPEGSRLILASVVMRARPVAVIAWEMLVGFRATPQEALWRDEASVDLDLPPQGPAAPPIHPILPLTEAETAFVTSVSQQVALGIENLRLRARDISALQSISTLPASRSHLDPLRQAIVGEVAEAFAPAAVALLLRDDQEGAPHVGSISQGQTNAAWTRIALQLAAEQGERPLVQHRGVVLAALVADHETLGWLALRLGGHARLTADRALVFTSLASTAALLLRNARLHIIAREAAVDRERQRIAREIHDGVAQNLAHLMFRLELVQRLIPEEPAKAQAEADGARQVLLSSLNDLRQSIAALAPALLDEYGFTGAVQYLVDDIATNHPELVTSFVTCPDDAIPVELRATAFRVVQEALANIRKHAHARHVWITVAIDADRALVVTVRDDGAGFVVDLDRVAPGHFGLRGMRERAEEFGGTLDLTSAPDQGTTVTLTLPWLLAV
jgi:signal transduction histidine kinase/GAF domain-containing protein